MAKKTSEELSLEEVVNIHGVEIKKMPIRPYFKALKLIKELPENFFNELLEGTETKNISDLLSMEGIGVLIGQLLSVAPEFTVKFLSELIGVKEEVFLDKLTPLEAVEVVKKFWEVNGLTDFFQLMKPVMTNLMKMIQDILGFKEQSQ